MSTYPNNIATAGGSWGSFNYVFVSETGTQFRYRKSGGASSTDIYFDTSDNKWYDGSTQGQPTAFWNKTVNPNGGGSNPSIACSVGDQIQLQDGPGSGNRGTFTHPTITSVSPSFGQVGHILTNTGHPNNSTSSTWECISIANNEYLYRHGTVNAYDFKYDVTNDQWVDANTALGNWPSHFGTSTTDSTPITPTGASQYLYLWDTNNFSCELENDGYTQTATTNWATPAAPLSNNTNTARNIQVVFTPTQTAHYEIVETTNNNKVHWSSNGTIGQLSANVAQTITFKVHTDVGANPSFRARYASVNPGTFVGTPYTPSSAPVPYITPQWGGISTANNNAGGQVVVSFATGFGNQDKIFYNGTTGDEIEIRDSTGTVHATRRFGPNFSPGPSGDTITIAPLFQPTEVGTSKTLEVRIRNTTHGKVTYHTFNVDPNNATQSSSYASPYTSTPPPAAAVTVSGYSLSSWTEQGAGATGNSISVSFQVANTTNSLATFQIRDTSGGNVIMSQDMPGGQSGTITLSVQNAGQSTQYRVVDVYNLTNLQPFFTTAATAAPPAGSVTVSGFNVNSWTEQNGGAPGNTVSVSFQVNNTTSSDAEFRLYKGGANEDQATMAAGQSGTITLSDYNPGQSQLMKVMNVSDNNNYMSPTFTTAATTAVATYTASALNYDSTAGTVTSNITGTANMGSSYVELWVDGTKHQERNTDGPLVYTFSTTPYNTTIGPLNFEVKLTGGSATRTLTQSHTTGPDPNQPAPTPPQQTSVSLAPAKGGRKRRFPIISTQLFNRQRSVYSIGTTHHEIAPQF